MARAMQLTVSLDNTVGMLAKLTKTLARAKVNIEAVSVADSADTAAVRLVATPVAKAVAAVKKAGMAVSTQPVLTVRLANAPGALAEVADGLAAAKVNIRYCYGSTGPADEPALLVFSVDDLDKAAAAVK